MKQTGRKITRLAIAIVSMILVTACQSTAETARNRLPFHIALAPIGNDIFEDQTATEEAVDESQLVRLATYAETADDEPIDITAVLGEELERSVFSEVSVLAPAATGAEGQLVAGAMAHGADLLMTLEQVAYDADLETKTNHWNWFWYLTGPAVYFFTDREYRLDSTIEVALYDIHRVPQLPEGGYVLDETALIRRFRAKSDWVKTRFPDRAEGGWDWAKSLIIPTNMLRKHGQQARRKIADESVRSMAVALAEDIAVDAEFVTRPSSRKTLFHLSEDTVGSMQPELVAQNGGTEPTHVKIEASVLQRARGSSSEFGTAEVRCGDAVLDLRDAQGGTIDMDGATGSITIVDDGTTPSGWVRKRVAVQIPVVATLDLANTTTYAVDPTIQIVLEDSRGDTQTRSWTFPIPSIEQERMVQAIEARALRGDEVRAEAAVFRPGS